MKFKFSALILAAGFGKRLRPITYEIPKCLVEVGGKPIIKYWLDHLHTIGCEEVLINTHYLSGIVQKYISNLKYKNMFIHNSCRFVLIFPHILDPLGSLIAQSIRYKIQKIQNVKKNLRKSMGPAYLPVTETETGGLAAYLILALHFMHLVVVFVL